MKATAASRLRKAAVAWTRESVRPPVDSKDSAFKKYDRKLQRAAIAFTREKDGGRG